METDTPAPPVPEAPPAPAAETTEPAPARNRRSAKITFSKAEQLHKKVVNAAARNEGIRAELAEYAESFGDSDNPIAVLLRQAVGEAADAAETAGFTAATTGRVKDALGELFA